MIPICAVSKTHCGVISIRKKKIDQRALSIDISDQQFRILPSEVLAVRSTIEHLIADGNVFSESALKIPLFPNLKTLTLSDNKIRDVGAFLQNISYSCPKLQTLVLTGNLGWPSMRDVKKYKQFRKTTLKMLPNLRNLDGIPLNRRMSTAPNSYFCSASSTAGSAASLDSISSSEVESICS